jgi:hypothetical protein
VKNKKPSIVEIEWGDAWGLNGWQSLQRLDEEHKPLPVVSVGFLFKKNRQGVTLVAGIAEDGTPLAAQFIPNGMIKKIKKVK